MRAYSCLCSRITRLDRRSRMRSTLMVSKSRPGQRNLDEGSLFLYKSSFPLNQAWKDTSNFRFFRFESWNVDIDVIIIIIIIVNPKRLTKLFLKPRLRTPLKTRLPRVCRVASATKFWGKIIAAHSFPPPHVWRKIYSRWFSRWFIGRVIRAPRLNYSHPETALLLIQITLNFAFIV